MCAEERRLIGGLWWRQLGLPKNSSTAGNPMFQCIVTDGVDNRQLWV